jgi:hypothetical protein
MNDGLVIRRISVHLTLPLVLDGDQSAGSGIKLDVAGAVFYIIHFLNGALIYYPCKIMHQDDPCHTADTKPKSKRRDQSNDTLIRGNHHNSAGIGIDARLPFTPSYPMKVSSVDNAPPLGVDVIDKVVCLIRHC